MRRAYRVIGGTALDGHEPGSVFHSDIPPATEARWLRQRRIAIETPADAPARSASRADWDAYAHTVGLDPAGFTTKNDLIAAIAGDSTTEGSD